METVPHSTTVTIAVVLLLCFTTVAPVVGATQPGADTAAPEQAALGGAQIDADDVVLRVNLRPDGDAEWAVEHRVRLDDENATAAFESLEEDIEENPEEFTRDFQERMSATADSAAETTDRPMAIQNVTVTAETRQLPQEFGVVTYEFTWTNFALVENDEIRAGDALVGLFLDQETALVFAWPAEYDLASVAPEPSATGTNHVEWRGPLEFGDGEPSLVVSTADTPPDETPTPPDEETSGMLLPLVGVAVLLIVLGAGWHFRDHDAIESIPLFARGSTDDTADRVEDGTRAEHRDRAASGADASADAGADVDDPPPELLSNEEQVLRLLERRGGRMKQQEVVQELDWTEAKTSQVVGQLREAGKVNTFRVGRENVITFPDEDTL